MKTKEELNVLKEKVETLNKKLAELTDEELAQVHGGITPNADGTYNIYDGQKINFDPTKFAIVNGTYLNATGNTVIYFHYYNTTPNGDYRGEGDSYECLSELLWLMI